MSILDKIGSFFTGVGSLPGDALKALEAAWSAVRTVWSFLTSSAHLLTEAWTWVVNGAGWFADKVESWAAEVYHTLWDTLTSTIPKAIAWVFNKAVHWAAVALRKAYNELRGWVTDIKRYLVKLIYDLVNALKGYLHLFVKWATAPIRWVLHWGAWIVNLLTHPDQLAAWLAASILEPVIKWFLKGGVNVMVWLLRRVSESTTEFAHLFEDAISRVW